MTNVVLFHSILGLRRAEQEIAAIFERDGHKVILPDLFGGRTEATYEQAFAMKKAIGNEAILSRAKAAVDTAPPDVVLSGISFGASLVGEFWGQRPKMKGALLFSGVAEWMSPRTAHLPVSVHIASPDPFDDEAFFSAWVAGAETIDLEFHRYANAGHFFLDRTLPDYDEAASNLAISRARNFLRAL